MLYQKLLLEALLVKEFRLCVCFGDRHLFPQLSEGRDEASVKKTPLLVPFLTALVRRPPSTGGERSRPRFKGATELYSVNYACKLNILTIIEFRS